MWAFDGPPVAVMRLEGHSKRQYREEQAAFLQGESWDILPQSENGTNWISLFFFNIYDNYLVNTQQIVSSVSVNFFPETSP